MRDAMHPIRPGTLVYFEYHCWESDRSCDAELWHRSQQPVSVLSLETAPHLNEDGALAMTARQRSEEGMPLAYRIRFADGFEHDATEDELVPDPRWYEREPPPARRRNPTKTYVTQPSGVQVEGQAVGKYLAIRKYTAGKTYKRYIIDHVPTGYMMFQYPRLRTARAVAKELSERFGDDLDFTDPRQGQELAKRDPRFMGWARVADDYPTPEDYWRALRYRAQGCPKRGAKGNPTAIKQRLLAWDPETSRLARIDSEEEMEEALKGGDAQLQEEIQRAVKREVDTKAMHTAEWEVGMFPEEFVAMIEADDMMKILEHFPHAEQVAAWVSDIPEERIKAALAEEIQEAADEAQISRGKPIRGAPLFAFVTGQGPGMTLRPMYYEVRVNFGEPLSWVSEDKMIGFLKETWPPDAEWEFMGDGEYTTGWIDSGDYWRLQLRQDAHEWVIDQRVQYYSDLIDEGGEKATKAFMDHLTREYPALAKRVRKAKIPHDVLADFAVMFLEDPTVGIENIQEVVGLWGYEGTRAQVLLEVDRDTLREIGVTDDKWLEGAPWRLLNLPVVELAYEGTLQRHCVGRRDFGYRDAVARGSMYIWSLRSRFNKPILTFEVNRFLWDKATEIPGQPTDEHRGAAIVQLKGKLNRLAGEDQDEQPDTDEQKVVLWIFDQLGVDPDFVSDFVHEKRPRRANPGFCAPWRPYHLREAGPGRRL
jgi:hypothetical protein